MRKVLAPIKVIWIAAAIAAVAAAPQAAGADTIVVRPGEMGGWVLATQQGTASTAPLAEFINGGGAPLGDGFFHMNAPYSDADPLSKMYFGTNAHSEVLLADITSLKYWTYLIYRDYGGSGDPNGQPPMIELITDSGVDTSTSTWYPQERRFVYKPYGPDGNHNVSLGVWQEWDLMAANGRWEMLNTSTGDYFGNWDWVKNRYRPGTMKIRTPVVGDYMDPLTAANPIDGGLQLANQSGTSLSIKIGSGRAIDPGRYGAWWRESCNINAYVDLLTVGINGTDTVYDFEAGVLPTVIFGTRAAYDPIMESAKTSFKFVVYGRATEVGIDDFVVDEGSGKGVRVVAPGHAVYPNALVRAEGLLDNTTTPPTLSSSVDTIEFLEF